MERQAKALGQESGVGMGQLTRCVMGQPARDGVEIVGLTAGTSTLDATIAAVERALQQLPLLV